MFVSKAAIIWLDYHRAHSKKNTVRAYEWVINKFCEKVGDLDLNELSPDGILTFLNPTRRSRNQKFLIERIDVTING
jgi:hypothetical protein